MHPGGMECGPVVSRERILEFLVFSLEALNVIFHVNWLDTCMYRDTHIFSVRGKNFP